MRNVDDLECMACPPKYRDMQSFHKYYSGEAVAPVLTIFSAPLLVTFAMQQLTGALASGVEVITALGLACSQLVDK